RGLFGTAAGFERARRLGEAWSAWQVFLFRLALIGMVIGYVGFALLQSPALLSKIMSSMEGTTQKASSFGSENLQRAALFLGGACAILAVSLPFLLDLFQKWRWRRIWAIARLSFKEALRRRILWGFTGFLVVLLFASWFVPYKPEDQVRNYVWVVYSAMTPL